MKRAPKKRPSGAGLRIYSTQNVHDALLERLAWIYDEFDGNVFVNVSGGKDSTVLFHKCLEIARERGYLPLKVYWLDQEAEWQAVVDLVGSWMRHPDVEPYWLQVPHQIFNASSRDSHWLHAWDPAEEEKWIHPADPLSYKRNVYGTPRFFDLFSRFAVAHGGGRPVAHIAGVRCEESPNRFMGLTYYAAYKWVTWGNGERVDGQDVWTFHPLYDWHHADVWKAIHEHGWEYARIYDIQYRFGIPVRDMRVSNLHHESAVRWLFYCQEFEPETYERLCARLPGVDMAGKFGPQDYFPRELPPTFESWREYRDYLLRALVVPEYRLPLARKFNEMDRKLPPYLHEKAQRQHVTSIVTQDWELVKTGNFMQGAEIWQAVQDNKPNWLTVEELPLPSLETIE